MDTWRALDGVAAIPAAALVTASKRAVPAPPEPEAGESEPVAGAQRERACREHLSARAPSMRPR